MMLTLGGCMLSIPAWAQNWSGSTVGDAKDKTVYLWNVGAKKFLGKGGRWGTEAVISNVGTPFKVVEVTSGSTYRLESVVKAQGTTSNAGLGFMNGNNSEHDASNYFVDRGSDDDGWGTRTFTFSGENTGYQLKVTSSYKSGDTNTNYYGTFFLFANMAGDGKAKGLTTVPSDSTAYSQWIVVTEEERKGYFEKAEASEASAVPATFLMFDNGFDRNDNNITKWQTKSSATASDFDGTLSWSNNKEVTTPSDAYPTSTTTKTRYYTYTYTGTHSWTVWSGWSSKTYTHDVTYIVGPTTNESPSTYLTVKCSDTKPGSDSQTNHDSSKSVVVTLQSDKTTYEDKEEVTTTSGYTYYNGNGYVGGSTTVDEDGNTYSSSVHWQELYGGDWTANIHGSNGVVNQTIPNANMVREGWYKVSCVGFTTATTGTAQLYASAGTASEVGRYYAVQPLVKLAADKQPATYVKASKLVNGGGYDASVIVYVGKNDAGELKTLSFGILVDGVESTAWTCFDNFQIDYLGMPNTPLVLDEEQESVDYINAQTTPTTETVQKKTLYLHRTLNADKWNSIVLPVSLTVGQVQTAFGDNAKLSAFKGAINQNYPSRMYFERVSVNREDKNAVAVEAGKLYIIKPSKEEPTNQEAMEFPEGTNITKTLTSYFTIPSVTFNENRETIGASVKGEIGDETYEGSRDVQFVGTYVAGEKLIPANSYVLRGNHDAEAGLWFYRTATTTTKGFRGWLQVLNPANAAKISFSINGIVDEGEITAIDGLEMDAANKQNANIYNLNGQLVRSNAVTTEGLAKGVYIQNGKKFIVK